jgi:uncharacterized Zn finger protein
VRENADAKADRLLVTGRVVIVRAEGRYVQAIVRGDEEGHHVVEHVGGRWVCDCTAAPFGRCSHRMAVQRITAPVGRLIPAADLQVGAVS